MGHLPSIDLVRVEDGKVFDVPIKKTYEDKERGRRSRGFRDLLKQFRHKVHVNLARHSVSDVNSVRSCPTWTCRSTRKQKVGCSSLGSIYNFPISRYKTLLVCTRRFAPDPLIARPMQAA